jgi:hypothetical protein
LSQGCIYIRIGSWFVWAGNMIHKKGKEIAYVMLKKIFVRQRKYFALSSPLPSYYWAV